MRSTLTEIGQVAAEVHCPIDGYREFVSVYATPREQVMNFEARFPYLDETTILYRAIRFRVEARLISEDADVCMEDLVGLQEIFLPDENAVEFIMNVWKVPLDALLSPRVVDIPV
jgi:hypothetical protein